MVDEQEKKEEEPKPDNTGEGVQSETISEIDRADQIAQMQKRENDRREKIIQREEALEARRTVGGRSELGDRPVKKEESAADYATEVMKGKYNGSKEN